MTDEAVAATTQAVLRGGASPVICVGETGDEREQGVTDEVLTRQVEAALGGVVKGSESMIVLAYEPVWAIGTGLAATSDDAQTACAHIRSVIAGRHGGLASQIRILYGGSAKAENAAELVGQPDVDGLLVGGASLEAESFAAIVEAVATCYGSASK
jgi:triosephosphate isomerase